MEVKCGPDDGPGQKRGLVLVEQGVLVATEWRSQELPLANEAAHHMYDSWNSDATDLFQCSIPPDGKQIKDPTVGLIQSWQSGARVEAAVVSVSPL